MPSDAPHPAARMVGVDRTVHEPARLAILALLAVVDEADFTFLAGQIGLSGGNLSSHLTKLEGAGYVTVQKEFHQRRPRTLLTITPAGRAALSDWRDRLRDVLASLPE